MTLMIVGMIGLIISTIMATIVWLRYRQQRSGKLFIATLAIQILLAVTSAMRHGATSPMDIVIASTLSWILLALLSLSLLLFFASLYAPEWWRHRRTIGWIALPYLLAAVFIALNNLFSTGLLVRGVDYTGSAASRIILGPVGIFMGVLFTIAWIPHLVLLIRTLMYEPKERSTILVLLGLLVASTVIDVAMRSNRVLSEFASFLNHVILIGALAYVVVQRRAFEATEVVMDQAIAGMAEGIAVLDLDTTVTFTNRAMEQHLALHPGQSIEGIRSNGFDVGALQALLGGERLEAILESCDKAIAVTASPVVDHKGRSQGYLLLSRDVTESRAYEQALQQRQAELLQTIKELQKTQASQQALTETIRSLSLPIIPVTEGVIVMPLIGVLDEQRAEDFEQQFLQGTQDWKAQTVVLDLTGVPPIDQMAASILMRTVAGAKLLGARTILVGIRPEIAQSIVALGIDRSGFTTAPTLQDALKTLLYQPARPSSNPVRAA